MGDLTAPWSALQFSPDKAVPAGAFTMLDVSHYGGPNHLDLCAIDRPDDAYDMTIANHVLEHVPDDAAALKELDRVTRSEGAVFLSVPDLLRVTAIIEYGFAREDKHGHYRLYGPDLMDRVRAAVPAWHGIGVVATDPVTGAPDRATLFTRSDAVRGMIVRQLTQAGHRPFDAFARLS
ncbi:MAG: methyltransferase domain-containing protein [Pseudomonadota bacterium]